MGRLVKMPTRAPISEQSVVEYTQWGRARTAMKLSPPRLGLTATPTRTAPHARFDPAWTFGQPYTADRVPERASWFHADQNRQLPHRLPVGARSDLRRFRVVRCRAGAARHGHLVEPAAMADRRSRDDAARVATPRHANDRRLGRGHRYQQPGRF